MVDLRMVARISAHQLQDTVLEIFAGRDLLHGAGRADLTLVDDGHMRAHLLDKRHDVR